MKPRYRPGKAGTEGRAARTAVLKAKPLTQEEMRHLREEPAGGRTSSKAGRKGKRARWSIDYEEGVGFDKAKMPCREPETFTINGVRRTPKRG